MHKTINPQNTVPCLATRYPPASVDFVLPPENIARELGRIARHVHVFAPIDPKDLLGPTNATLAKIYEVLRNFGRVDFSYYKPGTITRRITRRMFLNKTDNLEAYLKFLRTNESEVETLFNDVLINVTGFFRDPEAFDALAKVAFPTIMKGKTPNMPIRLWVPGCSTGEEAYSLGIVLLEFLGERASNYQIQIFATDVSEVIMQKARAGIYSESITMDMSARASAAVLPQTGWRVPDQQIRARYLRFREAGYRQRSAVLQTGHDQLQKRDDLYGTGPSKKDHTHVPLRIESQRSFIPRLLRDGRWFCRPVHDRRQEAQNLHEKDRRNGG